MTISSLGDLASSFQLRRESGRIKTDLARFTNELSTGVTSDIAGKLKGDYGYLASLEQGLARMESFASINSERRLFLETQQTALQKLRELGSVSATLLTLPEAANQTLLSNAGIEALSRFESAVGAMNTQIGGRSVFAGVATDQPAVANAETLLTALESEISLAGAVTAADVEAVVFNWFSVGGGYDTIGYTGGPQMTSASRLSDSEVASPVVNAEEQAVRAQFSALALGALLGRNVLAGNLIEQGEIASLAGERLIASNDRLVALQASIGVSEAQVDRASVEVKSQLDGLQIAKTELIEVDPYEVAIKLQNAEIQLQSIYAITARLSRLSLVEYL